MVKIHSVILIVCFLVFVALLAFPEPSALLFSALLLLALYSHGGSQQVASALVMLRRMRWFLFSILIVYCWFTPGEPVFQWAAAATWLPSYEGLNSGMQRVIALVMVIAAVNLLLRTLSREQLMAAVRLLVRPLQCFGVKAETVALRMILVIDAVSGVRVLIAHHMPKEGEVPRKLTMIGGLAARIFHAVVEQAQQTAPRDVVLPQSDMPPAVQWSLPFMLWGGFYLSALWWPL